MPKPASPWKTKATHVSVRSPAGGRWRAGRLFGPVAEVVAKADLTPRQAEMLLGDAELVVAEVADPGADAVPPPAPPPAPTSPPPAADQGGPPPPNDQAPPPPSGAAA